MTEQVTTTSNIIPELPIELIEYIIDHLHDDPSSLRSSSLTCRAWTNAARHHLFYEIMVISDMKEYNTGILFQKLQMILDFGGAIHHHIRRLSLMADLRWHQTLPGTLLQACFTHLTSLHTLTVKGLHFPMLTEGKLASINLAPQLNTFVVDEVVISDGFLSILGEFRALRNLVLKGMERYSPILKTEHFRPPPLLRSLSTDSTCDAVLLGYFLDSEYASRLESLSVDFSSRRTGRTYCESLRNYLHRPGIQLRHLSLKPPDRTPMQPESFLDDMHFEKLELHSCTALTSLQVEFYLPKYEWWGYDRKYWEGILRCLLPDSSPNIHHLTLCILEGSRALSERMGFWDWSMLETKLRHWDVLETITFRHMEVEGEEWADEWKQMILQQFATTGLYSRIRFDFPNENRDK